MTAGEFNVYEFLATKLIVYLSKRHKGSEVQITYRKNDKHGNPAVKKWLVAFDSYSDQLHFATLGQAIKAAAAKWHEVND